MSKLLCLFLVLILFIIPVPVSADTTVTVKKLQPGEVVLRNERDGTVYLTTQVVEGTGSGTATSSSGSPQGRQVRSPLANIDITPPEGFAANFSSLINGVLSFVLVIAALLVFLYLIWGAFDWITSGGDKGKTDRARQKIISAVIGLIIIASSYAILTLALRFLGFRDINDVLDNAGTIQGAPGEVVSPTPSPVSLEVLNASDSAQTGK